MYSRWRWRCISLVHSFVVFSNILNRGSVVDAQSSQRSVHQRIKIKPILEFLYSYTRVGIAFFILRDSSHLSRFGRLDSIELYYGACGKWQSRNNQKKKKNTVICADSKYHFEQSDNSAQVCTKFRAIHGGDALSVRFAFFDRSLTKWNEVTFWKDWWDAMRRRSHTKTMWDGVCGRRWMKLHNCSGPFAFSEIERQSHQITHQFLPSRINAMKVCNCLCFTSLELINKKRGWKGLVNPMYISLPTKSSFVIESWL